LRGHFWDLILENPSKLKTTFHRGGTPYFLIAGAYPVGVIWVLKHHPARGF